MKRCVILPTGGEIKNGTVLDTGSPGIMQEVLRRFPGCEVTRRAPAKDVGKDIKNEVLLAVKNGADTVIVVGGSGGGRRFDKDLSVDATHTALDALLEIKASSSLFGKNGHLWCRLVIGRLDHALVFNLPGPYAEAMAAVRAFFAVYHGKKTGLRKLNAAMRDAVAAQYGPDSKEG